MTKDDDEKTGEGEKRPFDLTLEQATDIPSSAGWFDRKKVLVTICASLAAVACAAMILNINSAPRDTTAQDGSENPAVAPAGFIGGLRDRAIVHRVSDSGLLDALPPEESPEEPEPLPAVTFVRETLAPPPPAPSPPPRTAPPPAPVQAAPDPTTAARHSRLVPERIEGSLFGAPAPSPPFHASNPSGGPTTPAFAAVASLPPLPPARPRVGAIRDWSFSIRP